MDSHKPTLDKALSLGSLCYPHLAQAEIERHAKPAGRSQDAARHGRTLPMSPSQTGFLDLPRELRDEIYSYVIEATRNDRTRKIAHCATPGSLSNPYHRWDFVKLDFPCPPTITQVSSLLRSETLPMFYERLRDPVVLMLDSMSRPLRATIRYLLSLSPFHLSCIQRFECRSFDGGDVLCPPKQAFVLSFSKRERRWKVQIRRVGPRPVVRDTLFELQDMLIRGCDQRFGRPDGKVEAMEQYLAQRKQVTGISTTEDGLEHQDLAHLLALLAS